MVSFYDLVPTSPVLRSSFLWQKKLFDFSPAHTHFLPENLIVKTLTTRLWNDQAGFIVSIELVLIATIAVIGLITGMTAVRDAVVSELSDVAGAVQDMNQSYSVFGVTGHSGGTAGMDYTDALDWCDDAEDLADVADNCIVFDAASIVNE